MENPNGILMADLEAASSAGPKLPFTGLKARLCRYIHEKNMRNPHENFQLSSLNIWDKR
jgi:hypothetical protein